MSGPRIIGCPGLDPVMGCTSAIDQALGLCARCRAAAARADEDIEREPEQREEQAGSEEVRHGFAAW